MAPYPYTEPSGVALYYIRGHFTSRALRSKQLSECPRLQLGGERVGIQIQFWCLKFLIILGPIFLLERGRQIKVEVEIQSGEGNGTLLQCSCLENPRDGGAWWVAVHGVAKKWARLSDFTFNFYFHALEKEMATYSSVLAWRIPGTGEPGGLPSLGSHRVRHDWSDLGAAAAAEIQRRTQREKQTKGRGVRKRKRLRERKSQRRENLSHNETSEKVNVI